MVAILKLWRPYTRIQGALAAPKKIKLGGGACYDWGTGAGGGLILI